MQFIFVKSVRTTRSDEQIFFEDTIPFVRFDALSAKLNEHTFLLEATFMFDPAKKIERGMRVIFTDTKRDGSTYLRAFEIRNVKNSRLMNTQTITAEDLGIAELTDSILPTFSITGLDWESAAIETFYSSLWSGGVLDPSVTIPPASITYALYKVATGSSSKLSLRSSPSSSAHVIGYYANGTKVKEISNYNSTWKKVEVGGKTGYMARSYLTFYKNITTTGTPTFTMSEVRKSRIELLRTILSAVGLKPSFRVEYELGQMARYIDYVSAASAAFNGARVEVDRDAYNDQIEYDDHELYTRVYPIGKDGLTIASISWSQDNGDPGYSAYNDEWVEDQDATLLYGREAYPRTKVVEFPEIENATDLINAGWAWLQTVNRPKFTVTLSIKRVGQMLEMGEIVNVVLMPVDEPLQASVIELTRDLLNPEQSEVTIGNYASDVVSDIVSNSEQISDIKDRVTTNIGSTVLDVVYPIGSIYMSVNNTNPGNVIGGTWAAMTGRFLVGAGTTFPAGNTGGASEHKHLGTSGFSSDKQGAVWGSNGYASDVTVSGYRTSNTDASGGSQGGITVPYTGDGSSLPPYLSVYMWKRTA